MREARYPRVELAGKRHNHRQPLQPPIELVHHIQVLYLLQACVTEATREETC